MATFHPGSPGTAAEGSRIAQSCAVHPHRKRGRRNSGNAADRCGSRHAPHRAALEQADKADMAWGVVAEMPVHRAPGPAGQERPCYGIASDQRDFRPRDGDEAEAPGAQERRGKLGGHRRPHHDRRRIGLAPPGVFAARDEQCEVPGHGHLQEDIGLYFGNGQMQPVQCEVQRQQAPAVPVRPMTAETVSTRRMSQRTGCGSTAARS